MKRRRVLGLAFVSLAAAMSACKRGRHRAPQSGDIATTEVEVSALLSLENLANTTHEIEGQGHAHEVRLSDRALVILERERTLIVRSGPATDNGHTHWVRVRLL